MFFFIFGTRLKLIISEQMAQICKHCGENRLIMHVFKKYFHIFWVPVLPLGRIERTECQHCKQVLDWEEMPEDYRTSFKILKSKKKESLGTFTGLIIIGVLLSMGLMSNNSHHDEMKLFIADPKVGDVYEYKLEPKAYTLFKVIGVDNENVIVVDSTQIVNKSRGLSGLHASPYQTDSRLVSKTELHAMEEDGRLIEIERK